MEDDTDVLIIGGGQAALSAAYFLPRFGLENRYQMLDHAPGPGGAWQFRWPTLTLATANGVHDLPGWGITDALGTDCGALPAATAVPEYFGRYEEKFGLNVHRPVHVRTVRRDGDGFRSELADGRSVTSRVIINATGTWDRPFIPHIPGAADFRGRQLHTHDYTTPAEFAGKRVLVVGAGISAIQLLIEIAREAPGSQTFWCSRREPVFNTAPFTPEQGREAVARVERRVRAGLPPTSVVSVTGLALTPTIAAAQRDGILAWRPMFTRITETGVCWDCGADGPDTSDGPAALDVDVIFWNTGFRSALDHLAPLRLRAPGGGITMTGRLATVVESDPRIQLLGYGPSASTIGANRAGREAARVAAELLGVTSRPAD
ncbi:SidA/IucD/PvdA family monooxygenase [Gordonia jinghuaiqii]|uniref:NAD(P)/FAD-dependent oxidoreductase n=1 Tax=Gordonia jinghuaiqii TaxID=2758710 RepID=A0A7D7LZN5_9ACTN|nr:NAD(P)-binding domain-containing protein [Gordonia jinghuaiqii]MCR5978381.1 SidA/IucD/PvdA family monooxygenase [Gordonia jinghuaiqii]QMT03758.1 NAD(P)/FAD-dependent oxidoreductase [Gordonia jinghuaiqii]